MWHDEDEFGHYLRCLTCGHEPDDGKGAQLTQPKEGTAGDRRIWKVKRV